MERTRGNKLPELKIESSKVSIINGEIKIQLNLSVKNLRVGQPSVLQHIYINNNTIKNNTLLEDKNTKNKQPTDPSDKDIRNKKYLPLAKRLSYIIKTNKSITHTTKQVNAWTNEIRRLEEENKISYERLKIMLDWYFDHIGEAYVPIIESGFSLRMKFSKLQEAMKRDQEPNKKEKTVIRNGQAYHTDKEGLLRNAAGERLIE